MTDIKDSRFKSYIDENELESITLNDSQKTKLLEGETLVYEANKVVMYRPLSDRKKETPGILTITTFRLSFVSAEDNTSENCYQQNLLLGLNDVCLSCIDTIYNTSDKTKKKLPPGNNISGKIKDLLIVCKNMKSFEFSFKLADKDSGKNIANALLHHAYPKRHTLLFAYDYKEPYVESSITKDVRMFVRTTDWKRELERTKCPNWRISHVNQNYQTSPHLMEALIVPHSVNDGTLTQAVEHFRNRVCPVWVWGTQRGAALVRMADLLATINDRTQENVLLENIRKSHPQLKQPCIIDLSHPTPKDVQTSFVKLRDLCTPDSTKLFKTQDMKLYALLDQTKWLHYVSICLSKACEAAKQIDECNSTVVLQEGNGQDLNCIISSLIQLMLDPHFRTISGFQSLLQKEWIAMGHPFTNRLGHILTKDIEPAPILLLFLDCVWQLLQQFPHAFQISETYLTTLWDSAHMTIFDTFLFNNEHDRFMAKTTSTGHPPLTQRSVWDWREQFIDKDIIMFCNPVYLDSFKGRLEPHAGLAGLEIWRQCYFRWLPDLEIRNGGHPQVDLCCRLLVNDILLLRDSNGRFNNNGDDIRELLRKVNGFYPFSHNEGQIGDMLPINNLLLSGDILETQSILNLNND